MKKNLPTPVVIGVIVVAVVIVGLIWWLCTGTKDSVTTETGLPPSSGVVSQPPAGLLDGGAAGPSQPGPQPGN